MTAKYLSYRTIIIIVTLIFLIILGYILIQKSGGKDNRESLTILEQNNREVGQSVDIIGILANDGDLRHYTHTLQTENYGHLGLKSREVNLSSYQGNVQLQGTIEGSFEDTVIIFVNNIRLIIDDEESQDDREETTSAQYNRQAGLYITESFIQTYGLPDVSQQGKILFAQGDALYSINYFTCTTNNNDRDCARLQTNFASSASKVFTTIDGMTFYKMPETNDWFTSNGNLIGYFFNNIPETDMLALSRLITFPTNKSIEQQLIPKAPSICKNTTTNLSIIQDYTLQLQGGVLHTVITGSSLGQQVVCDIIVDYSNPNKGVLYAFDVMASTGNTTETPLQPNTPPTQPIIKENPFDINVAQFPINLERTLSFTSNRGHTIVYPSFNIAFVAENTDTNLGVPGLRCYAQIYVVSYPNKDLLKIDPKVVLYECNRAPDENVLPMQYIIYPLTDTKAFIGHVVDGAWRDFANNIVITENTTE